MYLPCPVTPSFPPTLTPPKPYTACRSPLCEMQQLFRAQLVVVALDFLTRVNACTPSPSLLHLESLGASVHREPRPSLHLFGEICWALWSVWCWAGQLLPSWSFQSKLERGRALEV